MNLTKRIDAVQARLGTLLDTVVSEAAVEESKQLTNDAARTDDYQQIVNLMGRYASYHYYGEHLNTYNFFSHSDERTTAELGSTGVYAELDKIFQMFEVYHVHNNWDHTAHCHPLTTPYIQVAADRGSAKLFMLTNGFECLPGKPGGPQFCMWFYDGYDMDFVREGDSWKWLRFHLVDDIKAPFHISWTNAGKMSTPPPAGLVPPTYFKEKSFIPYSATRKPMLNAELTGPYQTY